jgi:parallel beta-helix repeat protein
MRPLASILLLACPLAATAPAAAPAPAPPAETRVADYASDAAGDPSQAGGPAAGTAISVKQGPYNAAGNGTANDTSAIQSAINAVCSAGGGAVFFPPGTYKVTASGSKAALTLQCSNVSLLAAKGTARIANASATGDTLQIGTEGGEGARHVLVQGLAFQPSVTRTGGTEVFAPSYVNLTFRDLVLKGFYRGFYLGSPSGCVNVQMFNVHADDFYQFAYFVRAIQGYFYAVEADGLRANTINVHIDGYCEGLVFVGCLFISNYMGAKANSYMLEVDTKVVRRPSQFNYFYGCYFDFGNYAVVARNAYSYTFTDCWFKGASDDGVLLEATANEFTFKGCDFFNSAGSGLYVNGSKGHLVIGNRFLNNGTAVSGSPGVRVTGAAEGIVITSNRIGRSGGPRVSDAGAGNSSYGVQIDAGVLSFVVKDNDCRGNGTGAVNNLAGTGANKVVADNIF